MKNPVRNVRKPDSMIEKIKELVPGKKIKATQTTEETTAKGWGIRVKQKKTETIFEEIDENSDERK